MSLVYSLLIVLATTLLSLYILYRLVSALTLISTPITKGELSDYKITVGQSGWTGRKLTFNTRESFFGVCSLWTYGTKFGKVKSDTYVEEHMTPTELEQWKREELNNYEQHLKLWSK